MYALLPDLLNSLLRRWYAAKGGVPVRDLNRIPPVFSRRIRTYLCRHRPHQLGLAPRAQYTPGYGSAAHIGVRARRLRCHGGTSKAEAGKWTYLRRPVKQAPDRRGGCTASVGIFGDCHGSRFRHGPIGHSSRGNQLGLRNSILSMSLSGPGSRDILPPKPERALVSTLEGIAFR